MTNFFSIDLGFGIDFLEAFMKSVISRFSLGAALLFAFPCGNLEAISDTKSDKTASGDISTKKYHVIKNSIDSSCPSKMKDFYKKARDIFLDAVSLVERLDDRAVKILKDRTAREIGSMLENKLWIKKSCCEDTVNEFFLNESLKRKTAAKTLLESLINSIDKGNYTEQDLKGIDDIAEILTSLIYALEF